MAEEENTNQPVASDIAGPPASGVWNDFMQSTLHSSCKEKEGTIQITQLKSHNSNIHFGIENPVFVEKGGSDE